MNKSIINSIVSFFVALSALGQTGGGNEPASDIKTVITGFLPEYKDSVLEVTLVESHNNLIEQSTSYRTVAKMGSFRIELYIPIPKMISLSIGGFEPLRNHVTGIATLIEPGDSVCITIPHLKTDSISGLLFSGKGIEKQFYIQEADAKCSDLREKARIQRKDMKGKEFESMLDRAAFQLAELNALLENYKSSISNRGYLVMKAYLILYISYGTHASLVSKNFSDTSAGNSTKLYGEKFLTAFDLSPELFQLENIMTTAMARTVFYERAILNYARNIGSSYRIVKPNLRMSDEYRILRTTYESHPIRDWLLASFLISRAQKNGWDEQLETIFLKYKEEGKEYLSFVNQVNDVRNKLLYGLSKNKRAPDFSLPDTAGNIVSLNQFRGKVVLLDFMFTGCVGCKIMSPKLKEVEDIFEGKAFSVISISIDVSRERFRDKGVGVFSSPGAAQLYTNGSGSDHEIIRNYQVPSYPTLVLIDKEGNIIDSRPPDPRTEEGKKNLIMMIEEALGK